MIAHNRNLMLCRLNNEKLCCCTFKFRKVVQKQICWKVADFISASSSVHYWMQQVSDTLNVTVNDMAFIKWMAFTAFSVYGFFWISNVLFLSTAETPGCQIELTELVTDWLTGRVITDSPDPDGFRWNFLQWCGMAQVTPIIFSWPSGLGSINFYYPTRLIFSLFRTFLVYFYLFMSVPLAGICIYCCFVSWATLQPLGSTWSVIVTCHMTAWLYVRLGLCSATLGVPRRRPYRRQELATLPSVGANP